MKNIIKRTLLIFLMMFELGMGFGIKNKVKNRFNLLKKKINKALKGREGIKCIKQVNWKIFSSNQKMENFFEKEMNSFWMLTSLNIREQIQL